MNSMISLWPSTHSSHRVLCSIGSSTSLHILKNKGFYTVSAFNPRKGLSPDSLLHYFEKFLSVSCISRQGRNSPLLSCRAVYGGAAASVQTVEELPPKLQDIVKLFETVSDPRAKYEQLLYYAKKLKPLAQEFRTKENKVEGCVSQVWVRAILGEGDKVYFEAESDSVLTKGLAALLVEGLSGSTVSEILKTSPDFIQLLGLKQSLTPSRSNGFFNMFKLMQKKALQLYMQAEAQRTSGHNLEQNSPTADDDSVANSNAAADDVDPAADYHRSSQGQERGSRKERIARKLEAVLMPTLLEVEDVSHEHAGHAGVQGSSGETHFNLKVVSSKFEGRSLVKRHRLVYELLQEELETGLHALSIVAKTPSEVDKV